MNYKLVFLGLLLLLFTSQALALSDANLTAYYAFEETSGSVADDLKGHDNNGTITNVTINQAGKVGRAYSFDGTGDYVVTNNETSFDYMTNNSPTNTICFWYNTAGTGDNTAIISKGNASLGHAIKISSNATGNLLQSFYFKDGSNYLKSAGTTNIEGSTWRFLCETVTGTTVKTYVNGNEETTAGNTGSYTNGANNNNLTIGAYSDLSSNSIGLVDEISVWNRTLSVTEIQDLYNSGTGTTYCGDGYDNYFDDACTITVTPIITSNQYKTITTIQLLGEATTPPIFTINDWNWLINGNKLSDNQDYNYTTATGLTDYNVCLQVGGLGFNGTTYTGNTCQTISTSDWTPPITTFTSNQVTGTTDQNITLTCTDNNSGCDSVNYNINNSGWVTNYFFGVSDTDLVSYYKLDETIGSTATDSKGTNTGTITGATINQTGKLNRAYDFNSVTNKIVINDSASLKQTANVAISFWLYMYALGSDAVIFSKGTGADASINGLRIATSNKTMYLTDAGTNRLTYDYTSKIGGWHFIVIDSNATGSYFYVDGALVTSGTSFGTFFNNAGNLQIGDPAYTMYSHADSFNGRLDEFSIWNRALTQTEILNLYNSGAGKSYNSSNSYSFLFSGAGLSSINYFSTDNSNNNETTKTSQFPMAWATVEENNSRILFYGATTYNGYTVTDWNWRVSSIDGNFLSDVQNPEYYTTSANTDFNVCLSVGNGTTTDSYCYIQSSWDTIDPTIDVNISFTPGFVTTYDINYSMQCIDNSTPVLYTITKNGSIVLYNSYDANASVKTGNINLLPPDSLTLTFTCTDDSNNTATYTTEEIYSLAFRLINEDTGASLTSADFNGLSRMFIKKIIAYDLDGNFSYDFNATATTTKNFLGYTNNLWFEVTYNNAGTDTKIDRKIDFGLINDTNIGICIPPLQTFYQQDFTSVSEQQVYLYQPNSKCYVLSGTTNYLIAEGYQLTTWTIAKPYQLGFINNGLKTFLALINGAIQNNYNLDAISFNAQAVTISIGTDTLAFTPEAQDNNSLNDSNILNIYFNSFLDNYVSTTLTIYSDETILYTLTEDTNANEFDLIWLYTAYNLTDQNMLKIVVVGTDADGKMTSITEYFNILGDEYIGDKDPSFIAIIVILFFLFGITMLSIGKTFGWFGIIICITSMAISLMAVQTYWLLMIEGGLFICFLYIFLQGGLVQTFGGGMR